jgi:small subunit ribosomal protein S6
MTREYEALIIMRPGGTEQDVAQVAERAAEAVKKLGGRVDTLQAMGRRRLAFKILRQTEGYYYLVRFHAPTDQVAELERLFRLNEHIVRFIILTEEELAPLQQPAAAAARA